MFDVERWALNVRRLLASPFIWQELSLWFHFFFLREVKQAGQRPSPTARAGLRSQVREILFGQRLRPHFSGRLALEVFLLSVRRLWGAST